MQFITDNELLKYSMLQSPTELKLSSVLCLTKGATQNSSFGGADLPAEPQEHLELHQLCLQLLGVCSVLLSREKFSALTLQGGLSGTYTFLENHVVLFWVFFKRSW